MNILFVMGKSYGLSDANSNLALSMMHNLKDRGHSVVAVGQTDNSSISLSEEVDGIAFERFYFIFEQEFSELKEQYIDFSKGRKSYAVSILRHPKILIKFLQRYFDKRSNLVYLYKKKIEQMCEERKINVVVAVANPFFTAVAMAKSNVDCKKVIYQLDPHSNIQFHMNKMSLRLHEEKRAYKLCDKIVITNLLYEENQRKDQLQFLPKMEVLNFPNIKLHTISSLSTEIVFDSKYINCAFIGFFYPDIRSPLYLLELFSKFKNQNIRLHIIGGGTKDIFDSYKDILGDRLCVYSRVPLEIAMDAMQSADILINVGNLIDNQMPSKIFDYISTGKPIINIFKIKNCPTLKYIKNYPYFLNVFETDSVSSKDISVSEKFCLKYKGAFSSFQVIQKLYAEYTIDNVVDKFEYILNNI